MATPQHPEPVQRAGRHQPTVEQTAAWLAAIGTGAANETAAVVDVWAHGSHTESTFRRLADLATRFAARLTATGVASLLDATAQDCENFLWAPTRRNTQPAMHTVHLRRTALRNLFGIIEQLDPQFADPSRNLDLPSKHSRSVRPLTNPELALVRTAALGRHRHPLRSAAIVALAETTATTTEIAHIRWHHIDLEHRSVELCGADPVQARVGQLTTWGTGVLHRWHDNTPAAGDDDHVIDRRNPTMTAHVAQASITNQLHRLIGDAGLHDPTIKPASIRLWGARQQLERHGIEHAARALGVSSLDTAAAALGHHWANR